MDAMERILPQQVTSASSPTPYLQPMEERDLSKFVKRSHEQALLNCALCTSCFLEEVEWSSWLGIGGMNTDYIRSVFLSHGFQAFGITDSVTNAHISCIDPKLMLKYVPVCTYCLRLVAEMPSKNSGCGGRELVVRDLLACHAAQLLCFANLVSGWSCPGAISRFSRRDDGARSSGSSATHHMRSVYDA